MVKLRLKEKNMNMNKRNWVEYEIKIKKSWAEEKTWGKHQKYKNSELDKNSEAVALHTVVSLLPSASELDHFHCNHQAWTMANSRVSRGFFSTSRIAVTHPQGSCVMIFSLTLRWNVKRKCGRVSKVLTDFAISAQSSVCGCCGHPWPALGSAPAYEHLLNMWISFTSSFHWVQLHLSLLHRFSRKNLFFIFKIFQSCICNCGLMNCGWLEMFYHIYSIFLPSGSQEE